MDMSTEKLDELLALDERRAEVTIYAKGGDPYLGANGEPSTITVVGSESKRVRDAQRASTKRLIRGRRSKLTPEDMEQNRIAVAAAAVVDWSGWEDGDSPLPCTPDNVRRLLQVPHILEQVESAVNGHADFFANASTGR